LRIEIRGNLFTQSETGFVAGWRGLLFARVKGSPPKETVGQASREKSGFDLRRREMQIELHRKKQGVEGPREVGIELLLEGQQVEAKDRGKSKRKTEGISGSARKKSLREGKRGSRRRCELARRKLIGRGDSLAGKR